MVRHYVSVRRPISLLSAQEVSGRLGMPLAKLYKLAATGQIPAVKLGRHWRFPRGQLEAWQKAKSSKAIKAPHLPLFLVLAMPV